MYTSRMANFRMDCRKTFQLYLKTIKQSLEVKSDCEQKIAALWMEAVKAHLIRLLKDRLNCGTDSELIAQLQSRSGERKALIQRFVEGRQLPTQKVLERLLIKSGFGIVLEAVPKGISKATAGAACMSLPQSGSTASPTQSVVIYQRGELQEKLRELVFAVIGYDSAAAPDMTLTTFVAMSKDCQSGSHNLTGFNASHNHVFPLIERGMPIDFVSVQILLNYFDRRLQIRLVNAKEH